MDPEMLLLWKYQSSIDKRNLIDDIQFIKLGHFNLKGMKKRVIC